MIKDKANPIKLGGLTMQKYHGHARFELRDVKTGKVEVEEHDNTFLASNIEKFLVGGGVANNYPASEMSYTNLLGGVFLFDTAIEDDGEGNYPLFKPKGVKMTANGSYGVGNNSDVTELGSYNAQESQFSNDALVFVYDWTTSQGNGAINSVCLTHRYGGICGYGNYTSKQKLSGDRYLFANQSGNAIYQGSEEDILAVRVGEKLYVMDWDRYIGSGNKTIKVLDRNFDNCNFFRSPDTTITVSSPNSNLQIAGVAGTVVYFTISQYSWNNGTTKSFYKMDLSAETPAITWFKDVTNSTGVNLNSVCVMGDNHVIGFASNSSQWVHNGSAWTNYTNPNSTTSYEMAFKISDGIYMTHTAFGNSTNFIFDETLGLMNCNSKLINGNDLISKVVDDVDVMVNYTQSYSYYIGRRRLPLYLATVCNLDAPIVKTADKTMKLTYTITKQVEE